MPLIIPSNSITGGYEVANSLRFDDGSTDYLNGSGGAGSTKTKFTFSTWVKRANITPGNDDLIIGKWSSGNDRGHINFSDTPDDALIMFEKVSGSTTVHLLTNRLFRDISAWYNIVFIGDTTQSTSSDRLKLFVNGVQETSFGTATYPSQNYEWQLQALTQDFGIGAFASTNAGASPSSFYLAEVVYLDGIVGSIGDFGEFDSDSPTIWKPKDVSGLTFGTNGFYLDFENSGSLGADVSGNGNNFTVNNLTSIDQTTDTCTNNFATFNALDFSGGALSNGNLTQTNSGACNTNGTIGVTQGKWYWEFKMVSASGGVIGIGDGTAKLGTALADLDKIYGYSPNGNKYENTTSSSYGATYTTGDIISVAFNADTRELEFYKNGVSQGVAFTVDAGFTYLPQFHLNSSNVNVNFGNPPFSISSGNADANGFGNFEYSVPSGYFSLCTKNLAEFG